MLHARLYIPLEVLAVVIVHVVGLVDTAKQLDNDEGLLTLGNRLLAPLVIFCNP